MGTVSFGDHFSHRFMVFMGPELSFSWSEKCPLAELPLQERLAAVRGPESLGMVDESEPR